MKNSLRICFAIALCGAMASLTAIAQTSTQMGVNYNGLLTNFNITDITTSRTTWIRAFFDVTDLLQRDGTCAISTVASDLMQYAANTTGVTGIDLHMHVSSYNGNNGAEGTDPSGGLVAAVQYAQSIFGKTKPMMASEFSLVNYFENYLGDDLSSSFLTDYPDPGEYYLDVTGKRTVLGFINYSLSSGSVPSAEWYEFLKSGDAEHPTWFTDRALSQNGVKNFLALSEAFFSSNNFSVATYAMAQNSRGILYSSNPANPSSIQPWPLNALFCDSTCTPNPTFNNSLNLDWIGDFWAQQP
jgi:hypothetical protein